MTREQQDTLLEEVRISRLDAVTFSLLLEAVIAKHEHKRRIVRPEPEPEVIEDEVVYL